MLKYSIPVDFTDTPGARYKRQGPFSGEQFREECLDPLYRKAKEQHVQIEMTLDGAYGYPASFLEESFGGLARLYPSDDLFSVFEFVSNDQPSLVSDIKRYIDKNKDTRR